MEGWAVKYCKGLGVLALGLGLLVMVDRVLYGGHTLRAGVDILQQGVVRGEATIASAPSEKQRMKASAARQLKDEEPGPFLGNGFISMMFLDLSITEAQGLFHGQMIKHDFRCNATKRFGNKGDGGYDVCLDKRVTPTKDNCLVYSFGIRNDWSFDDAINAQLGCEVHSFDPSIHQEDHLHKPNMHFHNLGIWGSTLVNNEGWKLASLSEIVRQLGHQNRIIDYVKLDVEGAEFPALRELVDSGVHRQIKQLAVELHTPRLRSKHEAMSLLDYAEIYTTFVDLERAGFGKFMHLANNGCCGRFSDLTPAAIGGKKLCCYEGFYVNKNLIAKGANKSES